MNIRLYNEITREIPKIGDYVIDEYYSVGIILGTHTYEDIYGELSDDNYYNGIYYRVYYPSSSNSGAFYNNGDNFQRNVITITPYLAKLLLSIDNVTRNYLYSLIFGIHFRDELFFDKDEMYYKYIGDYLLGNINPIIHSLLFKSGIKQVISHNKGKNLRIVEFNNGQVWEVKRHKNTCTKNRKNISKYNEKKDNIPIRSVKYTLLRRLE